MPSAARSRKIFSINEPTYCRETDFFKIFNRHGYELFGTEEMGLNHRSSLLTIDLSYLIDEPKKVVTPLPNLEHDLGIDNNDIYNPTSLSNVLFVEEGQLSTPLHKDVNVLHLNTTKQSSPIIAQPDDDIITSVDENHYTILTNPSSNTKFSQDPNILEEID